VSTRANVALTHSSVHTFVSRYRASDPLYMEGEGYPDVPANNNNDDDQAPNDPQSYTDLAPTPAGDDVETATEAPATWDSGDQGYSDPVPAPVGDDDDGRV
jgi:hypothetical protein